MSRRQSDPRIQSDPDSRFLLLLARALHAYGTPSHRLEEALEAMSEELAVDAQYLVTPTSIVIALGTDEDQRTYLQRVEPGEVNLERLADLNGVMQQVAYGSLSTAEGHREVKRCLEAPLRYSAVATATAFAAASSSAAVLFGGGWRELVVALTIGGVVGCLALAAFHRPRLANVFPALVALVAAAVPVLLAKPLAPLFPFIATLAGTIVLVPGLSLTIAVNELANRHLVSGTARLTGSFVTFLQIGLGVALGLQGAEALVGTTATADPLPLPGFVQLPALGVTSLALMVLFRARPRDLAAIATGALVAYGCSRLASDALGTEIGAAFGAIGLGTASNLFARIWNRPSAIMLLPGLLLIVPGSVGLRSLRAMLESDVVSGIETAFSMGLVAISLVTGLFIANLVLPSRKML